MVPFLESMNQGCKLQRKELLSHCTCESHSCQPANSTLSVVITTKATDKQPYDSGKNQQSYRGKGVENKQPSCL